MRFSRRMSIDRVDLDPLFSLVPPLHDQWRDLRFDETGALRNPLTAEVEPLLALSSGQHGRVGATYVATADLAAAGDPPELSLTDIELLADDGDRLSVAVREPQGSWNVDLEVDRVATPNLSGSWRADLTALLRADMKGEFGVGCISWFMGGKGVATGTLVTPVLDEGGRLIDIEARINRFRVWLDVDIGLKRGGWRCDVRLRIAGRGLGRLVLLVGRRRVRAAVERALDEVEAFAGDVGARLAIIETTVDEAGGPHSFVRQLLWSPEFRERLDPGPASTP